MNNFEQYKEHRRKMKEDPAYAKIHKDIEKRDMEKYWMNLKPFKTEEDVPALPKMDEFYVKRLIELGAIPKKDLENGVWYYGNYRNTDLGKWNAKTEKFDHYRMKFGWRTDDCNHFEDDDGYALFVPIRKANEKELEEIKKIEKELR